VGLAQAMIHDPEVLILDEPTSGLDPNQLADIRLLIKQLAEEKTVIFSTHIMQEVEALCNKVVIINQGNIVANSTIEGLSHLVAGQQQLVVEFSSAVSTADLLKIKGVSSVKSSVRNKHVLLVDKRHDVRAEVFSYAVQNKLILLEMFYDSASVEDIFQKLTKLASA
jgi:ABC-2 type transport system ATP-binding protein